MLENNTNALAVFDSDAWKQLAIESVAAVMRVIGAGAPFDSTLMPSGDALDDSLASVVLRLRAKDGAYRVLGAMSDVKLETNVIFIFALGAALGEHLFKNGYVINHANDQAH